MANAYNINRLNIVIHTLWDLEINTFDLNKTMVLNSLLHNLREIKEELIKEREKRLAQSNPNLTATSLSLPS
jgi:hypothetical protein